MLLYRESSKNILTRTLVGCLSQPSDFHTSTPSLQ